MSVQHAIQQFAATHDLTVAQSGDGRLVLVLHGGGGPATVQAFASAMGPDHHVVIPTHPGFAGTIRPADFTSVKDLAALYVELLQAAGASDVLVIGSSLGGWIAAEMALLQPAMVAKYILIDAVGIGGPGLEVLDVASLPPGALPNYSFHDPNKFHVDPATLTAEQKAVTAANFAALAVYGGNMRDPDLRERLRAVRAPVLVVWGQSDRVVTPDYGRAYARAFKNAELRLIQACGHLPQIEQPAELFKLIDEFA